VKKQMSSQSPLAIVVQAPMLGTFTCVVDCRVVALSRRVEAIEPNGPMLYRTDRQYGSLHYERLLVPVHTGTVKVQSVFCASTGTHLTLSRYQLPVHLGTRNTLRIKIGVVFQENTIHNPIINESEFVIICALHNYGWKIYNRRLYR
jgi:hypothetical protein